MKTFLAIIQLSLNKLDIRETELVDYDVLFLSDYMTSSDLMKSVEVVIAGATDL